MQTDDLQIQWLDSSGWSTTSLIDGGAKMNGQMIQLAMQDVQRRMPGKRIRAVDGDGRLVDML